MIPSDEVPKASGALRLKLLSREQAILEFNRRVLAQAQRDDVPLLERLRYICIVSSNFDEFFEVRYADVLEASRMQGTGIGPKYLADVSGEAHRLVQEQYRIFNEVVGPALKAEGIDILNHADRDLMQREWVSSFFHKQVRPLLVPIGLDPSHPFPQVANKTLNFIAKLGGRDAFGRDNSIAIVRIPRVLPRVILLPEAISHGRQSFVLLSSVIRAHLHELFPGREILFFSQFRVTRDTDIDVDEDDVTDLRQALRTKMTTRQFGQTIRLEVVSSCPPELSDFLLEQFGLTEQALYKVNGPVNLVRLTQLIDQVRGDELRFPAYLPGWPKGLPQQGGMLEHLRKGDIMLHHPFESFDTVVEFLREAVHDPDVLAIKQTIYRTGSESVLMELLLEAVRRGKEVLAVVELKARFDEEANINWAERLEALGAQVVYGIVGLKTHAKMMLVTRREGTRLRRYAHLSTGNYNPRTAGVYTDVGYLTTSQEITADVDMVFQQLSSLTQLRSPKQLMLAPFGLQKQLIRIMARVGEAALAGLPARIVLKLNSLTDEPLIVALIEAGQAGAKIDLIIRGACVLPPGVPGFTDNIRVRSVVGRMLEHTRILYFRWGESEHDEALYLSSADWMNRNMTRRIEVAWPVRDLALRQRVIDECLVPYLMDSCDAWQQLGDGRYERVGVDGPSAQRALMELHRAVD
ncbi:polyphosphate kinase 1 [Aquabacterium sp.]|uniref:polyphosphate kinase 1 n=1 Tax=Aquabacterium sp. TaxID=1872578 RepID=UPI00199E9A49|nr:polyphosphate kinase 1 [Aquabacterium sp.]MBC7698929.1 polyphosphate kinase 1 [Aquabacterium sp.]